MRTVNPITTLIVMRMPTNLTMSLFSGIVSPLFSRYGMAQSVPFHTSPGGHTGVGVRLAVGTNVAEGRIVGMSVGRGVGVGGAMRQANGSATAFTIWHTERRTSGVVLAKWATLGGPLAVKPLSPPRGTVTSSKAPAIRVLPKAEMR